MTTITSHSDVDALTLTFVATFDADVPRVWQIWADPRQLERWWGPPDWPATFVRHDFVPGGASRYYMTGPEGEKEHCWWTTIVIDAPHRLEFDNGFAGEDGEPDDNNEVEPMHMTMTLEDAEGMTRMTTVTAFASTGQLELVLGMGMEEGMREAMEQIEGLLAE